MQPFEVNVLDYLRTLTEKLVSLVRCSLADNYMQELSSKIRHFYDLYYLWQDEEVQAYLQSGSFESDFVHLLTQDRQRFDRPTGWQDREVSQSPLLTDWSATWATLCNTYTKELPDLAYMEIPGVGNIEDSMSKLFAFLPR